MRRRPRTRLRRRLTAAAAVALAAVGAAAHAEPVAPVEAGAIASSAGFVGCAHAVWHAAQSTEHLYGCLVALPAEDGRYQLRAMGTIVKPVGPVGVRATWREDGVVDASALRFGGDAAYPTLSLHIPAGVLPRTGAIDLEVSAAYAPGYSDDSERCVGDVGRLNWAVASEAAQRDVAPAFGIGTWSGHRVTVHASSCSFEAGAFWHGPVRGFWAFDRSLDEGALGVAS